MSSKGSLAAIERRVVACTRCPELRAYCAEIARVKKREHRERPYWGRPVPAFGEFFGMVSLRVIGQQRAQLLPSAQQQPSHGFFGRLHFLGDHGHWRAHHVALNHHFALGIGQLLQRLGKVAEKLV